MNLDIAFEYDDGLHHEILEKVRQQIGSQLDNLICNKHRLPPHITIVNIKPRHNKDIVEFRLGSCCQEFAEEVRAKLESIANGFVFKVSSLNV